MLNLLKIGVKYLLNNKNMSVKERNLLKGAVRRVFSRSDVRKMAISLAQVNHTDPNRKRVKKWGVCAECNSIVPLYLMAVDHKTPIIPVESALEYMTWDDVIDRAWCDPNNLQALCEVCHTRKTKEENKSRRQFKKERKLRNESKTS